MKVYKRYPENETHEMSHVNVAYLSLRWEGGGERVNLE